MRALLNDFWLYFCERIICRISGHRWHWVDTSSWTDSGMEYDGHGECERCLLTIEEVLHYK